MRIRAGITVKLALVFVVFAAVLLFGVTTLSYTSSRSALLASTEKELYSTALEKQANLDAWASSSLLDLSAIASLSNTQADIAAMAYAANPEVHDSLVNTLRNWVGPKRHFLEMMVLDTTNGRVIAATDPQEEGAYEEDRPFYINGQTSPTIQTPYYEPSKQQPVMVAAAPVRTADGHTLAVLAGFLNLSELNEITARRSSQHESDDAFLINNSHLLITQPRLSAEPAILTLGIFTQVADRCLAHDSGVMLANDYRDVPVIAAYRWLTEYNLCLIAKLDQSEALAPAQAFALSLVTIGMLTLLAAGLIAIAIARQITRRVLVLQGDAIRIGRGELDYRLPETPRDELGLLAHEFNAMAVNIAHKQGQLHDYANQLEQRVEERTKALSATEQQYRSLFANMREGLAYCQIILDDNGHPIDWVYLDVNTAFTRITGLVDVIGKTVTEVIPGIRESSPVLFEFYGRAALEGQSGNTELYFTPLGMWLFIEVFSPAKGYFVTTFEDITARKQAEQALQRSEEQVRYQNAILHGIIEIATEVIFTVDLDYRYTYFNRIHAQTMKAIYGRDIAIGQCLLDTMSVAEDRAIAKANVDRAFKDETLVAESYSGDDQLARRYFEVSHNPIHDAAGQVQGVTVLARDVTERKQTQLSLQQQAIQLETANHELEAFTYSVSHDLRAPLRAIDGFSRLLLEDYATRLPAEAAHYLQRVRDNAQQMGLLIDDLLAFSRLSRQALNRKRVAVQKMAQEIADDLCNPLRAEGRHIEVRIGELPECQADPALLKQVFINLISNALKFTRIREWAVIEVGFSTRPDDSAYFVKDNGVGFDMKYADKLFGVFQRLHRAEEYEGTGVGLAIVQRIVNRHGGRVWAQAALDHGAVFYFALGSGEIET